METYAQYRITVSPPVAERISSEWVKYSEKMMSHTGIGDFPKEFRVEGVITIERLKFIKDCSIQSVPNNSFRQIAPIVLDKQEYAPRRPCPEHIYRELFEITFEVWQYTDL